MNDVAKFLQDVAGYTEKEVQEKFVIKETETEWIIRALGYLDGKSWNVLLTAVTEKGGGYEKDQTTKTAIFHLPKADSALEPVVTTSKPDEVKEQGEYALSKSIHGKLGQLVPCLEDGEGVIFDGVHRKKINPNAWTVKLDHIKTPVDRAMARMTVNFCRRHYTSEEMEDDIGLLIGAGYTVQQICEVTGISERTVYRYMPQQLKDEKKVEAGQSKSVLPPVTTNLKPQDTLQSSPALVRTQQEMAAQIVDCEVCGRPMDRSKGSIVGGKIVCPKCAGKNKQPLKEPEPQTPGKPKETGEFRRAQMHPQKSKLELAVIQELQAEGLPLETDQEFCIQKTVPDAVLKLKDRTVAIYIDNVATHEEGNERDEWLRSQLEKLYGFDICVVQYKSDSQEEREKAKETIREYQRW
jgi:hypothetical protein